MMSKKIELTCENCGSIFLYSNSKSRNNFSDLKLLLNFSGKEIDPDYIINQEVLNGILIDIPCPNQECNKCCLSSRIIRNKIQTQALSSTKKSQEKQRESSLLSDKERRRLLFFCENAKSYTSGSKKVINKIEYLKNRENKMNISESKKFREALKEINEIIKNG